MATILKVTRLANPRGGGRRRARMTSPKQIAIFGTPAQKAALRRSRAARRVNPRRRRNIAAGFHDEDGYFHPIRASHDYSPQRAGEKRKRKRKNPALVVTLGALNPRHTRSTMATRRRRRNRRSVTVRRTSRGRFARRHSNPKRVYRRRRHNARIVVVAPRRRRRSNPRRHVRRPNARRHNRRHYGRRHNPSLFGQSLTSTGSLKLIGGGLVGVAAAKFLPTMLPAGLANIAGGGFLSRVLVTGVSAFAAGWAAGKVDRAFGDGVLFGGLMQTASVALNALLPGFSIGGVPIGMGELMPGAFSVPQNPLRLPPPPPQATGARVTINGLARAYGPAF